jgi:hypothetical protein
MAASGIGDLGPAVDLIVQPLVLEVLVAVDRGELLKDTLPVDTETEVLEAALLRLAALGAIEPASADPFGRHHLTTRGGRLLRLLEALDPAAPRSSAVTSSTDPWPDSDRPGG